MIRRIELTKRRQSLIAINFCDCSVATYNLVIPNRHPSFNILRTGVESVILEIVLSWKSALQNENEMLSPSYNSFSHNLNSLALAIETGIIAIDDASNTAAVRFPTTFIFDP
ncbi:MULTISPECIES: hypothetical protein [unclassified Bifidobacterium]|uniref:hypothetical protein n=1 Tax=unclassified Bifidobacterium TaxID=2608897 RepID=UPI0011276BA5|nr:MULTISPECIES: hypothetical protein [unclassified Bifidobacterium]